MRMVLLFVISGLAAAQDSADPKDAAQPAPDVHAMQVACQALFDTLDSPGVARDYPAAVRGMLAVDPDRQKDALSLLAAVGTPGVIPWITSLVGVSDASVRLRAGLSLKQVVEGIALKRRDPAVGDRVVLLPLGEGDIDLQPLRWVILQMLEQPDDGNTHAYAATMIRYLELTEMIPELRSLLQSRHPAVTRTAQWAIGELGNSGQLREVEPGKGKDEPSEPPGLPKSYPCARAPGPIVVDGQLDDGAWAAAPWTDDFVDIQGDVRPAPRFRTRVKMLRDDEFLYIAAEMEEPHLWGELTKHDSVIYHENDFEVFIDPEGDDLDYGEFEINVLGTCWDLRLTKPYRNGGHADNSWQIPGLQSAIHVDGTVNDPSDVDRGWSLELAFPWSGFRDLVREESPPARAMSFPPQPGDVWRLNFSRVQWRREVVDGRYKKLDQREDNWVWTPQAAIDMHRPETWGFLRF